MARTYYRKNKTSTPRRRSSSAIANPETYPESSAADYARGMAEEFSIHTPGFPVNMMVDDSAEALALGTIKAPTLSASQRSRANIGKSIVRVLCKLVLAGVFDPRAIIVDLLRCGIIAASEHDTVPNDLGTQYDASMRALGFRMTSDLGVMRMTGVGRTHPVDSQVGEVDLGPEPAFQ